MMLVLAMIAAIESNGELFLTRINRVAGRLTAKQRQRIGMERAASYSQVDRALTDLSRAVEETVDNDTGEYTPPKLGMGLDDLASLIVSGVLPEHLKNRPSVAVDSTDYETHRRRRAWRKTPDVAPGSLPEPDAKPVKPGANESGWPRIGDDGRIQATFDPDAREGYRAGKNLSPKGVFVGWDLHFAACVGESPEDAVAPLTTAFSIKPAGDYKADGGLGVLDALIRDDRGPDTALVDRGYSYLSAENWARELGLRGIEQVCDLHTNQRGVHPGPKPHTIFVDGALFIDALPTRLRNLPGFSIGETQEETVEKVALYEERLPYLFARLGPPDLKRGTQRVRGPALTGRVRCPNNAKSMRLSPATRPTLDCDPHGCACSIAPTLGPDDHLQIRQRHPYGTQQWKADYNRRNHVESYNASIKFHHSRLARGSTRVLGTNKTGILVALLVAANNIEVLLSAYEWDPGAPNVPAEEVTWRPSSSQITKRRAFAHRTRRKPDQPPPGEPADGVDWLQPFSLPSN
ncbi:hypothetical protein ACPUD8_11250 [Brevibacterium sp. FAM 25378]